MCIVVRQIPNRTISRLCFCAILALFVAGCGSLVHHRVEKGDTLYSIGFYYGHDYRDIAKWNNIPAPYVITRGQWLIVTPPGAEDSWEREKRYIASKNEANENKKSSSNNKLKRPIVEKSKTSVVDYAVPNTRVSKWQWPTKGTVKNSSKSLSERKKGINIIGAPGQPIYATAAGKVVYSGSGLIGFGNLIIIKHNKTYLSAYGHNERILVGEGDTVRQGQKIAHMGKAQDNRAQLHFEIRKNGKPVDPLRLLVSRSH